MESREQVRQLWEVVPFGQYDEQGFTLEQCRCPNPHPYGAKPLKAHIASWWAVLVTSGRSLIAPGKKQV